MSITLDCPVCFENTFEHGDLLWLECLHPLCKRCLRKLEKKICPLCRRDISLETIPERTLRERTRRSYSDSVVRSIRVRARRRRRRRAISVDMLDIMSDFLTSSNANTTIITESFENVSLPWAKKVRKQKNPNKCEKRKRGNWANMSRQTYGNRCR